MLRLSQGHLNLLAQCPPKFARTYLGQTGSLPDPELEEHQVWGKRFHLLMQQRDLGLPIDSLLAENNELDSSIRALIQAAPELFRVNHDNYFREAEYSLTLSHGDYLLTAIYDLLVAGADAAQIVDWKTYPLPQDKARIGLNWQTRLYLYLLAETSEYEPEQISMTYWFVKLPQQPKSHTFSYSSRQHEKTKADLQKLIRNLDDWRQDASEFACRQNCEAKCLYYSEIKGSKRQDSGIMTSLDTIVEVPI